MSIVSSTIIKHRNRGNGSLSVFEQHTDHNGDVHEHRYHCPVGYDIDQALIDWVPVLEAALVDGEKESVQQQIEDGVDPASITVKHLTNSQKARRVVKAMMFADPVKGLKAAEYVQGFTDAQIETFFTSAQRVRIRARQNYILDSQTVFDGDLREVL